MKSKCENKLKPFGGSFMCSFLFYYFIQGGSHSNFLHETQKWNEIRPTENVGNACHAVQGGTDMKATLHNFSMPGRPSRIF